MGSQLRNDPIQRRLTMRAVEPRLNPAGVMKVGTRRVFERFRGLKFFPFRRRFPAHPPATNASRWAETKFCPCFS